MTKAAKVLILILLVFIIAVIAYFTIPVSQSAQFLENEKITLVTYKNYAIDKKIEFPPNSKLHDSLNRWLKNHRSNWKHSLISYTPGTCLYSKGVFLNLHANSVVINYVQHSNDTYTQVIQEINVSGLIDELLRQTL